MKLAADYAANAAYPVLRIRGSYATQEKDTNEDKRNAFFYGYKQAEKDTVEWACRWLSSHLSSIVNSYKEDGAYICGERDDLIKLFRKDMEEGVVWHEQNKLQ